MRGARSACRLELVHVLQKCRKVRRSERGGGENCRTAPEELITVDGNCHLGHVVTEVARTERVRTCSACRPPHPSPCCGPSAIRPQLAPSTAGFQSDHASARRRNPDRRAPSWPCARGTSPAATALALPAGTTAGEEWVPPVQCCPVHRRLCHGPDGEEWRTVLPGDDETGFPIAPDQFRIDGGDVVPQRLARRDVRRALILGDRVLKEERHPGRWARRCRALNYTTRLVVHRDHDRVGGRGSADRSQRERLRAGQAL